MVVCGLFGGFANEAFDGGGFYVMAIFAILGSAAALWLRRMPDRPATA